MAKKHTAQQEPTPGGVGLRSAAQVLLAPGPPSETLSATVDRMLRERHRAHILNEAVELAIRDESFRKQLAAKLRDLGEGRPRRATSAFDLLQVVTMHQLLTLTLRGSRRSHLLRTPRVFEEIASRLGITPSQAKERYYLAKRKGVGP